MTVPRCLYDRLPDGIVAVAMLCFALPHACVNLFSICAFVVDYPNMIVMASWRRS